jgi:ABC-type cobalamin transport system permease subunit
LQSTISARPAQGFNAAPIVATIFGIPAVVIVVAALNDASLPIVGSGRGALIGLWILVSLICSQGIASMRDRFGLGRASLVGLPLGILATALIAWLSYLPRGAASGA